MRSRPIEPMNFVVLATVLLTTFVFQLVAMLYCGVIYPAARPSTSLEIRVYNEAFQWSRAGSSLGAVQPSAEEVDSFYPVLAQELRRYPRSMIERMHLRRVVLCSHLTMDGKAIGGVAFGPSGTVFLNVRPPGRLDTQVWRWAIHHELFHVLDRALVDTPAAERRWANLNSPGFEYGGQELRDALDVTGEDPGGEPEVPGFLDHYAMVSPEEDRAELFACMVVQPERLRAFAAADGIVSAKRRLLESDLRRFDAGFAASLR